MSVKEKSFWSTTSGVVTGVAGTLTGVVGLVTLATQQGWLESDDASKTSTGGTTEAPAAPAPGGRTGAQASPTFAVSPSQITFEGLGSRAETVEVENTGEVPISVGQPKMDGSDRRQFSASAPTCTRDDLDPGRSCEVEVTFKPDKAGTPYSATLVIEVAGARAQEVDLSGSALLP